MQILAFLFPGILLLFSRSFHKKGLPENIVFIVGTSLAFFVIFPWFLKLFGISLMVAAYITFVACVLLIFYFHGKILLKDFIVDRIDSKILLLFIIIIILRLVPMLFQAAPAGPDMSMHAYIARLVYDNDGIPDSYEPLFPISNFGSYPSGFPIISAVISLVSGMPVYSGSFLLSCLAHALVTFGLYVMLLHFFDRDTSAATALIISFFTRSPQSMMASGSNPTVLALFFFVLTFSMILEQKKKFSLLYTLLAAVLFSATLITHPIVFYCGALALFCYFVLSNRYFKGHKLLLLAFPTLTLFFLLPLIFRLKLVLTLYSIATVRALQYIDMNLAYSDLIAGIPIIILSVFGLFMLVKKNRKTAKIFIVMLAALLVIMVNYRYWFLPFSYLLYPGRISIFFIIPLSVFCAPMISKVTANKNKILLCVISAFCVFYYFYFYLYGSVRLCPVTRADLDAFSWMDKTIGKKAVIENNYGDAGIWIPAMIGRTITSPHSEPVHAEELFAGLKKLKAKYIFIGSKAVFPVKINKESLEDEPWKYKRLYSSGGAQVWKILD